MRMTSAVAGYVQSRVYMDTTVTIQVATPEAAPVRTSLAAVAEQVERAFGWFREVEQRCTRFEAASELRLLCSRPFEAVEVSPLLFRVLEFALAVSEATGGAFDPTVGSQMVRRGFSRSYRTDENLVEAPSGGCFRDIELDRQRSTVTLRRPLLLDLGAVAKGFAIDLAAAELQGLPGYLINAGGDIRVHGVSPEGEGRIGVRDPNQPSRLLDTLELKDGAVCSSGGYERPASDGGHHIVSPADGASPMDVAGVTVVAPTAMVADALSTAAFVLGVDRGIALLEDEGVEGIIVTTTGLVVSTRRRRGCRS